MKPIKLIELFTEGSVRQVLTDSGTNYKILSLSAVDKSPAEKYKVTFHASDGRFSCRMIKSIKSIPQELLTPFIKQCDVLIFASLNLNISSATKDSFSNLLLQKPEAELINIINIVNPKIVILDSSYYYAKWFYEKEKLIKNQYCLKKFRELDHWNKWLFTLFRNIVGLCELTIPRSWKNHSIFILKNEVKRVDYSDRPVSKEEKEKVTKESVTKIHNLLEKWKKNGTINLLTLLHEDEEEEERSNLLSFIKRQSYDSFGNSSGDDFHSFIYLLENNKFLPRDINCLKQKRREVICAWPFFKAKENSFLSLTASESPDFIAIDKKKKTIGIEVIDFSFEGDECNMNAAEWHFVSENYKSQSRPDYKKSNLYFGLCSSVVKMTNENYSTIKKNSCKPLDKHFKKINKYCGSLKKPDELIFVVKLHHFLEVGNIKEIEEQIHLWIKIIKEVFEENAKDKKINDDILSNIPIKCFVYTKRKISENQYLYKEFVLCTKLNK